MAEWRASGGEPLGCRPVQQFVVNGRDFGHAFREIETFDDRGAPRVCKAAPQIGPIGKLGERVDELVQVPRRDQQAAGSVVDQRRNAGDVG